MTEGQSVVLTEDYTSSIDATEWFGQLRRYLRRHGWEPLDEREAR